MRLVLQIIIYCGIVAATVSGCSGGFTCPFNRPACCDNVLFGCGTFELPGGCSCSDYFLNANFARQYRMVSYRQFPKRAAPMSSGTWRIVATKDDPSSCPLLLQRLSRKVRIRESARQALLNVPGILTLEGKRVGNKLGLSGERSISSLGCRAKMGATVTLRRALIADVRISINAKCRNPTLSCNATYQGTARKLERQDKAVFFDPHV